MNRFENISLTANLIDGGGKIVGDPLKQQQDPAFKIFDTRSLPATSADITSTTEKIAFQSFYQVITGSNTVISHDDNVIDGDLYVSKNLRTGVQISGRDNAMVRSVGYEGFISASLLKCAPGFILFSGSVLPHYFTPVGTDKRTNYAGVGLEMHAGNGSGSFRFRADDTGSFIEVIANEFFFGNASSSFISGSGGILVISSSNFFLDSGGNVIIQGTIIATAGQIDGWIITSGTLYATTSGTFVGMSTAGDTRFFAGATALDASGSAPFNVKFDGSITASAAYVSGTVFANQGGFGGSPQNPFVRISSSNNIGELIIKATDGHDATFLSSNTVLRYGGPDNIPVSGSNLIVNPSFDVSLASWSKIGNVSRYITAFNTAPASAQISGNGSVKGKLFQSVTLQPRSSYLLSYFYRINGDGVYNPSNLEVTATLGSTAVLQKIIGFQSASGEFDTSATAFSQDMVTINTSASNDIFTITFGTDTVDGFKAVFIDDVSLQPYLQYTDLNAKGLVIASSPTQYVLLANGQSLFKGTSIIGASYKSAETNQRVTINDVNNNRIEIYRDNTIDAMVKMGQNVVANKYDGIDISNGMLNVTISSSLFSDNGAPFIFTFNLVSSSVTASTVQVLTSQAIINPDNAASLSLQDLRLFSAGPFYFNGTMVNSVGYYYNVGVGSSNIQNHYGIFSKIGALAPGTNKFAIYGESPVIPNSYAGFFNGSIAIVDGTQAVGYTLTSDAFGNATWQPAGGTVTSASHAETASFLNSPVISASHAETASFFAGIVISSSHAETASFFSGVVVSASHAETASFALNGYWTQSDATTEIHRIGDVTVSGTFIVSSSSSFAVVGAGSSSFGKLRANAIVDIVGNTLISGTIFIGSGSIISSSNAEGIKVLMASGSGNEIMELFGPNTRDNTIRMVNDNTASFIFQDKSRSQRLTLQSIELSFVTNPGVSRRMLITSGGFVGINNETPTSLVDISGSMEITGTLKISSSNTSGLEISGNVTQSGFMFVVAPDVQTANGATWNVIGQYNTTASATNTQGLAYTTEINFTGGIVPLWTNTRFFASTVADSNVTTLIGLSGELILRGSSSIATSNQSALSIRNGTQAQWNAFGINAGFHPTQTQIGTKINDARLFYGAQFGVGNTSGSVDNIYGLYLDEQIVGTNKWGIFQSGSSSLNYFGGPVSLGKTGSNAAFDVLGNATISGTFIVSGSSSFAIIGGGSSSFGKLNPNAFVDIFGNTIISGSLTVSGNIIGVVSVSTGSFATTGSNAFIGKEIITGSLIISGSSGSADIGLFLLSGSETLVLQNSQTASYQVWPIQPNNTSTNATLLKAVRNINPATVFPGAIELNWKRFGVGLSPQGDLQLWMKSILAQDFIADKNVINFHSDGAVIIPNGQLTVGPAGMFVTGTFIVSGSGSNIGGLLNGGLNNGYPITSVPLMLVITSSNGGNIPVAPEIALTLERNGVAGQSFNNYADFKLSRYTPVVGTNPQTQLDIGVVDSGATSTTVLSLRSGRISVSGSLLISGSIVMSSIKTISGVYTASKFDSYILANTTPSTASVLLYKATENTGAELTIKNIGTGTLTVFASGSDLIDSSSQQIITTQWTAMSLVASGNFWFIV